MDSKTDTYNIFISLYFYISEEIIRFSKLKLNYCKLRHTNNLNFEFVAHRVNTLF